MVAFGFSVGDFIAGINLLIEAASSMSNTHGAQADYQGLSRQLRNLTNSLDCIQALNQNLLQPTQAAALDTALKDCRRSVDDFVQTNKKFKDLQNATGGQWSLATLKRQGRKIQWALWKKADVIKFQCTIQTHAAALQSLLASIQMYVFGKGLRISEAADIGEANSLKFKARLKLRQSCTMPNMEIGSNQFPTNSLI